MVAQSLLEHHVEVRQSVEFVHRRGFCGDLQKLLTQFALDVGTLGELEETPCCSGACCFVAGDDKSAEL